MPERRPTLAQIQAAQAAYKAWAEVALRARAAGRMDVVAAHQPPDGASATAIRWHTRELRRALGERSPSKFGNRQVRAYGFTFDSGAELRRYEYLKLLELGGEIVDLQVHPRYVVADAVDWNGGTLPAIAYEADFAYSQNGKPIVEDVKGAVTRVFVIKRSLFVQRNPGITFVMIDARCV